MSLGASPLGHSTDTDTDMTVAMGRQGGLELGTGRRGLGSDKTLTRMEYS
jgi:hypothetical protein